MLNKKIEIKYLAIGILCFCLSELNADSAVNMYTPRGTLVGDSYSRTEYSDPTRADCDDYYANAYPNATQLTLWGDDYSSSRRYNCHGYAWHLIGDDDINDPIWLGYNSAGMTYKYWQDESYSEVAVANATMVDYSGDHSATTTTTTDVYISKWNWYPLMLHHKDYHPGYGTADKFLRKNPATPSDFATIQAAVSDAVSGQIVHVDAGVPTLTTNVAIPTNVTLKIHSSTTVNLGSYSITTTSGTITIESGADINPYICLKTGSTINGLYPSLSSAISAASSGQTIEMHDSYTLSSNITIPSGVTLAIQSDANITMNNYTITAASGAITVESGASISPDIRIQTGTTIDALYTSITSALSATTTGQSVHARGTHNFTNNLSIAYGKVLKAESGAQFNFVSGKYIAIYGTLNGVNATFNRTSGTWGGIRYYSNSAGTLTNCTITNASYGIYIRDDDPVIDECTISNTWFFAVSYG